MSDSVRRARWAAICIAAAVSLPLAAVPVGAAPLRQDAALALPAVGLGATLSFPGREATVQLSVPVPPGMAYQSVASW